MELRDDEQEITEREKMLITYTEWEKMRSDALARIYYPKHLQYLNVMMAAGLRQLILRKRRAKVKSLAGVAADFAIEIPEDLLDYEHSDFFEVIYRLNKEFGGERSKRAANE